jgi:hypothetical protein
LASSIEEHLSSDVHLTDSQKTDISKISTLETSLQNHVDDTDVHVTAVEKTTWNSKID